MQSRPNQDVGPSMPHARPDRFRIALRLRHPRDDLTAWAAGFGLTPSRHWTVGQPRTTPAGTPLDGVWNESYWTAPPSTPAAVDLEAALGEAAGRLERHEGLFTRLAASGGTASLFIGFFLGRANTGFSLGPSLMARFGSLGIALEFDLYGEDDSAV